MPEDEVEDAESALATTGGKNGYELFQRFLKESKLFLKVKGRMLVTFSSLTNKEYVNHLIGKYGYKFVELSSEKISFEELYVYALTRK